MIAHELKHNWREIFCSDLEEADNLVNLAALVTQQNKAELKL